MTDVLQKHFNSIGAWVRVRGPQRGHPSIDVGGNTFFIDFPGTGRALDLVVANVDRPSRHLLLVVRGGISKFLCGRDERHYFVAAVPEDARGVTDVRTAMAALQPEVGEEATNRLRRKDRTRRRTEAFIRQGEWFFVPEPKLRVPEAFVLRNERLTRGRGTPHLMQRAYRRGGTVVYVSGRHPQGLTQNEFERLSERVRRSNDWETRVRDAEVYAEGTVRHPDHATIQLNGWHRVLMNTEQRALAMQHVAFID